MTELPEPKAFGDYAKWPGRAVLDPSGSRLGEVREIYLDDATDRPEWVLVELNGEGPRFVPLVDATVDDEALRVAQDAERVKRAPALEPSKELTQEEERRLYSHYGLRYSEEESDSLLPVTDDAPAGDAPAEEGTTDEGATAPAAASPSKPSDGAPVAGGTDAPSASGGDAAPLPSAGGRPRLRRYVGAGPELPAPGETSEPKDTGPMVPPRPEPVAPPPLPPPEPEPSGPLAAVRDRPAVVAGVAASLAALIFILLRRRG
jgi:hypothetical protein